jgi:hypothetical protein
MGYNGQPSSGSYGFDEQCFSQVETVGLSEDYVMIPNARLDNPEARATRFCGNSLESRNIVSTPPFPFMLIVNTDRLYDPQRSEVGFRISYEIS